MSEKGRVYGIIEPAGSFKEFRSDRIKKPAASEHDSGLKPLDLISLADDDEPTPVLDGKKGGNAPRVRNTGDAFMSGSPDALKLEQEIASLRAQYDRQNSKTVVMEAATEKTLILNSSADQTVIYRRQPGGASEHQLPTEKTGIIDMKKDQGFKRAAKSAQPAQPPAQPSRWQRFKGLFSKSI
jgi:hypothetical protein